MTALTMRQSAAVFLVELVVGWSFVFAFLMCLARISGRAERQWDRAFRRHHAARDALARSWRREQAAMDLPPASAVLGRADGLMEHSRPFDAEVDGL